MNTPQSGPIPTRGALARSSARSGFATKSLAGRAAKRLAGLLMVTVLAATCLTTAFAQSKRVPARQSPPATEFDSSVERLPPGFSGHDCMAIGAAAKKLATQKDEFETQAAYEKRLEELKERPLLGSLLANSRLAFVAPSLFAEFKYSPEREVATIALNEFALRAAAVNATGLPLLVRPLKIHSKNTSERQYVGTNAFGARVLVSETRGELCALAPLYVDFKRLAYFVQTPELSLSPERARSAKENLGILFISRLVPPFVVNAFEVSQAKIDWPYEVRRDGPALAVHVEGVWFFDRRTGEVLAKIGTP